MPRVCVYPKTPGSTTETTALSLVSMRDRSRPSIAGDQAGLNLLADAAGEPEHEPEPQPHVDACKPLTEGEDASAIVHSSPNLTMNESVETVGDSKAKNAEASVGKEESCSSSTQDCAGLRCDGDNGRSSVSSHQDGEIRTESQARAFKPSIQQNDLLEAASSTAHEAGGENGEGTTIRIVPERTECRETNESIDSSEQGTFRLGHGSRGKGDARQCDRGGLKKHAHLEVSNPASGDNVGHSEDVPTTPPAKRAKCGENEVTRDEMGNGNMGNTCDKREDKGDHGHPRRVDGDRSTAAADREPGSESHDGNLLPSRETDSAQDGGEGKATIASSPVVGGSESSTLGCDSGASVSSPAASTSKLNPAAESDAPKSMRSASDEIVAKVTSDRTEREQAHELRVPPMVQDVARGDHGGTEAGEEGSVEGSQSEEDEMELTQTESRGDGGEQGEANHVSTSLSSTSGDACVVSANVKPVPKGRSVSGRDWKVRKQSQR